MNPKNYKVACLRTSRQMEIFRMRTSMVKLVSRTRQLPDPSNILSGRRRPCRFWVRKCFVVCLFLGTSLKKIKFRVNNFALVLSKYFLLIRSKRAFQVTDDDMKYGKMLLKITPTSSPCLSKLSCHKLSLKYSPFCQ